MEPYKVIFLLMSVSLATAGTMKSWPLENGELTVLAAYAILLFGTFLDWRRVRRGYRVSAMQKADDSQEGDKKCM